MQAHGSSDIVELNHNSENWAVVKAALVAGMYPNVIHIDQETSLISSNKKQIHFHPSSVLNQFKEVQITSNFQSPPPGRKRFLNMLTCACYMMKHIF